MERGCCTCMPSLDPPYSAGIPSLGRSSRGVVADRVLVRFPKGAPWTRFHGEYRGHIDLVWPGKDPLPGVGSVGTKSAALVTYASIQLLKPDLIINAGTVGGFKARGAGDNDQRGKLLENWTKMGHHQAQ